MKSRRAGEGNESGLADLLAALQRLGEEAAAHFGRVLPVALNAFEHTVVVTHVPPFLEASWHDGRFCDPDWLPFFTCKAVGDVLSRFMMQHPARRMTVLCGHTHGGGTSRILPNLIAVTGSAEYGNPAIQAVYDWN
ncbi:MAG: hypothetical protein ACOX5G_01650 [Kiritimatiellia bacterium]|jgi:Icc protein